MSSIDTSHLTIRDVPLTVSYYHHAGEPMVMYYKDGSGHPGEPPSIEIQAVYAGEIDIRDGNGTIVFNAGQELVNTQIGSKSGSNADGSDSTNWAPSNTVDRRDHLR